MTYRTRPRNQPSRKSYRSTPRERPAMGAKVVLSPTDLREAAYVGTERAIQNIVAGTNQFRGAETRSRWHNDILAACGERAVAKFLGIPWDGNLGDWTAADVGPYEVRTRSRHSYDLLIYKTEMPKKKDRAFILATSEDPDFCTFFIRGWVFGHEGMVDRYWLVPESAKNWTGGPCWMVPHSVLYPIRSLSLPDAGWFRVAE